MTPNYAALASGAVHTLSDGSKVFAGQRRDGFFVDLGSIFDLGPVAPQPPGFSILGSFLPPGAGLRAVRYHDYP